MWIEEYEQIIRAHSRTDDPMEAIQPETAMTLLGFDSLEIINLIVDLEDKFRIELPEEVLTPETFATPGGLWAVLEEHFRLSERASDSHGS
jgi:acyl carrier protein